MSGILVDTNVLIEVLRSREDALFWFERQTRRFAISSISLTELWAGMLSRREEVAATDMLAEFRILPIEAEIATRAGVLMKHYRSSYAVDLADALIAATAEHHELPLATLNVKHFPMFPRLKAAY